MSIKLTQQNFDTVSKFLDIIEDSFIAAGLSKAPAEQANLMMGPHVDDIQIFEYINGSGYIPPSLFTKDDYFKSATHYTRPIGYIYTDEDLGDVMFWTAGLYSPAYVSKTEEK